MKHRYTAVLVWDWGTGEQQVSVHHVALDAPLDHDTHCLERAVRRALGFAVAQGDDPTLACLFAGHHDDLACPAAHVR